MKPKQMTGTTGRHQRASVNTAMFVSNDNTAAKYGAHAIDGGDQSANGHYTCAGAAPISA